MCGNLCVHVYVRAWVPCMSERGTWFRRIINCCCVLVRVWCRVALLLFCSLLLCCEVALPASLFVTVFAGSNYWISFVALSRCMCVRGLFAVRVLRGKKEKQNEQGDLEGRAMEGRVIKIDKTGSFVPWWSYIFSFFFFVFLRRP